MHNNKNTLKLEYPCTWVFKIIGDDQAAMRFAVKEIIQDRSCSITLSRSSETAKYHCLNVDVMVESESHRKIIYESLQSHRAIKVIL